MKKLRWIVILLLASCAIQAIISVELKAQQESTSSDESSVILTSADVNILQDRDLIPLSDLLFKLEQHFDVTFLYKDKIMAKKYVPRDEIKIGEETGQELSQILDQLGITFQRIDEQTYVLLKKAPHFKVTETEELISGTVTDASSGEILPGVNILVKGTSTGTSTDAEGQFELTVPSLQDTLVVSFVGYATREVAISGRTDIDITLSPEAVTSDEVVVVGYGTQKRSDLTGSISSINREEILREPVYSIDNVLQGKASGVNVTTNGFRPGETSTIRIRGERSFSADNEPLVVVDGVPVEGLQDFNPKNVESVEVLKDASATAIYGSRGSNGVILVTTRRGQEGRTQVEYKGSGGFQYTFDRLDMMDTQQYAEFVRNAHRLEDTYTGNDEDIFPQWQLEAIEENRTTDWQDLILDRGFQQNHSLTISGGSESTQYAITGAFDDHQATVINNDYRRASAQINLDHSISSRFRAGVTAYFSNSLRHLAVGFNRVIKNSPMVNPFDEHGNVVMRDELGDRNPLFDMQRENNLDERSRTRVLGTLYAEADIIPEQLTLRTTLSPDFRFRMNGSYRRGEPSTASKWEQQRKKALSETTLDYQTTLFGAHRLDLTAMYSIQNFRSEEIRLGAERLPYEHQLYHNVGSGDLITGGSTRTGLEEWTLASYMLRTNYVYDDRYYLTITGRLDGSSRLAEGNQYGIFPSMAVAWQMANENFMEDLDFLSELKIRFSIGETGNTAISPYETQGVLSGNRFQLGGEEIQFFEHGDLPNEELRWERTRSIDIGLDFSLMNDRFRGTVEMYQSSTYDLLMHRQLPYTSGYTSTLENVGETQNRGLEFEFSSVNIQTQNFTWSTDLNFATNRNEIVSLYGGTEDDPGSGWFIGEPIDVHYYWQSDGIWQSNEADEAAQYGAEPGDVKISDLNEDGIIDDEDRVILGNSNPKWTAGITNRFQYKNWDLSMFIYTSQGTMHRSRLGSSAFNDVLSLQAHDYQENQRDVNYWMPDDPSNQYQKPRLTTNPRTWIQAYFDTSFIRIRNISLGYSIPQNIISRLGARNARIYASAQNPLTITSFEGYDPEGARGYDMPNYTTFLLGIDLSF